MTDRGRHVDGSSASSLQETQVLLNSNKNRKIWETDDWGKIKFEDLPGNEDMEDIAGKHLVELEAAKDKLQQDLVGLRKSKEESKEDHWKKKVGLFEDMKKRVAVTAQNFAIAMTVLGPRGVNYLQALTIELKPEDWPEWVWLKSQENQGSNAGPFNFPSYEDATKRELERGDAPWPDLKTLPIKSWWRMLFANTDHVEKVIHWTLAGKIVAPQSVEDELRIIMVLKSTGSESGVFNTPLGRSVLSYAWHKRENHYRIFLIFEIVFLALLGGMSCWVCEVDRVREFKLLVTTAGIFAMIAVARPVIEVFSTLWKLGPWHGISTALTFWNVAMFVVEILNVVVMIPLLLQTYHGAGQDCMESALLLHPVMYAFIVGSKWVIVIMELMCTSTFGKYVFPAMHAITRRGSTSFIAFLGLAVSGCMQVYLSLPIEENQTSRGASAWVAFMKVFRLALLGDFDVGELEGIDQVITGDVGHGNISATISEGAESETFHDGIVLFILFVVISIGILSMNVAIGVVSNLYDDAKANANQLHCNYRAGFLFKMCLYQYYTNPVYNCLTCHRLREAPQAEWLLGYAKNDMDEGDKLESIKEQLMTSLEVMTSLEETLDAKLDAKFNEFSDKIEKLLRKVDPQERHDAKAQEVQRDGRIRNKSPKAED